jgi:hypothetical protein
MIQRPDVVFNDDWGQLSEEAFLRDFAGDRSREEALVLYAVQQPFKKSLTADKTTNSVRQLMRQRRLCDRRWAEIVLD